jgi:hypothetical protein
MRSCHRSARASSHVAGQVKSSQVNSSRVESSRVESSPVESRGALFVAAAREGLEHVVGGEGEATEGEGERILCVEQLVTRLRDEMGRGDGMRRWDEETGWR